jgi:hypothetical protein
VLTKTLSCLVLVVATAALAVAFVKGYSPPAGVALVLGLVAAASAAVGAAAYRAGYARGIADACLTDDARRLLGRRWRFGRPPNLGGIYRPPGRPGPPEA